jgi:exopolysaccharide biosynthesis predicted pyruvyltransferase EpsI
MVMNATTLPAVQGAGSVREELARLRGRPVYFERLHGNHGDKLIELGSLAALQATGVELVQHPLHAEAVVFNGGAAMSDVWRHGLQTLAYYNCTYPFLPLTLLPTTYGFTSTNFAEIMAHRSTPAVLFARERGSFDLLRTIDLGPDISLGLGNDMAFELRDSAFVRRVRAASAARHVLVVERGDNESITGFRQPTVGTPLLRKLIPYQTRVKLKRILLSHRAIGHRASTPFACEMMEHVLARHPETADLPVVTGDISLPEVCTFSRFVSLIAESAVVVTTRLHVGILAAMLGKPTYIKAGGWHKIRGIYEHSLVTWPGVHLV